ncbi:MAG: M48 family metallopeptidase [Hyphomicrobium sp.]|nr:M48 family metalloprotease [Hyphomicrobium sp.]
MSAIARIRRTEKSGATALQRQYERALIDNPRGFYRRLAILAFAGCAVAPVLAVTSGALGVIFLTVAVRIPDFSTSLLTSLFAATYLYSTYKTIRAIELSVPKPDGMPLEKGAAPDLFALIEGVRSSLNAPRIDAVIISNILNAAACQRPMSLIFGRWRNELVLGSQLLAALPEDELKSIIAHELGHFSGDHGKAMLRASRARLSMHRLEEAFSSIRFLGFNPMPLLEPFLLKHLSMMTAIAGRQQEFEADKAEVRIAGAAVAGNALKRIAIATAYRDTIWNDFWNAGTACQSQPARWPYDLLHDRFHKASAWPGAQFFLAEQLAIKTDPRDTHPCLRDRLHAMGADETPPPPVTVASIGLLGTAADIAVSAFDKEWWDANKAIWFTASRRASLLAAIAAVPGPAARAPSPA